MAELRSDKEMEKRMQYGCIALLLLRAEKIDRIFYVLYYLEDLIKASGNLIFPAKFYTIYVAA